MLLPQVGHWPSWAAIDSLASSRDEQYGQLKPYRFPPREALSPGNELGPMRGGAVGSRNVRCCSDSPPPASAAAPTPAIAGALCAIVATRCGVGTFSAVRQVGHRTSCPT